MFPRLIAAALLTALLIGCVTPGGAPSRASFDRPIRDDYVQLVNATTKRVEVDSAGRAVTAVVPENRCIPRDSIQTLGVSVFMLVDGCGAPASEIGGVLSLSIANAPLGARLEEMERRLASGADWINLGYGGSASDVSLVELRRQDGALYALVEDVSEFGPAFAGDLICRAFLEVNGRMVVVSLISLRDTTRSPAELQAEVARIVRALGAANA